MKLSAIRNSYKNKAGHFDTHVTRNMHFGLCLMLVTMSTASFASDPVEYSVTVNATTNASIKAKQTLVGIEVETTGHSIVGGGLSSQMLFDSSFEDPKDDPSFSSSVNRPACPGPCHWSYSPGASIVIGAAFNGNRSVILQPASRVSSAGLYGRGLSLVAGSRYEGYLFAKAASDAVLTIGLSTHCVLPDIRTGSTLRLAVTASEWTMVNFSLPFSSSTSTPLGCLYLEASSAAVQVDQVFLEHMDGLWRKGSAESMHLRGDVTDALLLRDETTGAVGLQALRLNGGMIGDTTYVWKNLRGPAWSRPVASGSGSWTNYQSYPFAMFDALELAEKAGVGLIMLGINVWHETPETARDLVDYLFGDNTTTYGALRAADGHLAPYNASHIIIELGNEETKAAYWDVARPILTAMRTQCASLYQQNKSAGGQELTALKWSIMYCAWGLAHCNATIVERIAADTASIASSMVWDQHDGAKNFEWPDFFFKQHGAFLALLRGNGWTQDEALIIGETNCGGRPSLPMAVCSSLNRALVYSLFVSDAVRSGYTTSVMPAVWAYATCDSTGMVCGGADGGSAWLQPELVITSSEVIKQPSWYAHRLISHNWGDVVLPVSPNRTTDSSDPTTFLDVLALSREADGSVAILATYTGNQTRTLHVTAVLGTAGRVCDGNVRSEVLSAANISAINTQADPNNVVPTKGEVVVADGVATMVLLPHSISTFTLRRCK